MPVYLHYCGGQLEEVNYMVKASSCCGDTEDHESPAEESGCCKDEGRYVQYNTDFTFKKSSQVEISVPSCDLFHTADLSFYSSPVVIPVAICSVDLSPPRLQDDLIITTSVLRI